MGQVRISLLISCLLLLATVLFKAFEPDFIIAFQNRTFDLYQRLKPRDYEAAPVRIIDIDDGSLSRVGQWPWPRTILSQLTRQLQDAGAAAIVFDIVFAEPDRTSPRQMATLWKKEELLNRELRDLPDHDELFARTLASAPVVTGFVLTTTPGGVAPASKAGFAYAGEDPRPFTLFYQGAVSNLPMLQQVARGNGAFNNQPDVDGILRRVPLLMRFGEDLYPSLAAEAIRVAQGAGSYVVKTVGASGEYGGTQGITALKIGNVVIPTDAQGSQWVYYSLPAPERYIPAWQVLDGKMDPARVAGHIVFIGTSAAGLKDIRATPISPVMPGVEVHAQSVEQALLGITISRPEWIKGAEIMLMVFAGLLVIMVCDLLNPLWGALFMFMMLAAASGVSWYAFSEHHILVEPIMPGLAVALVHFSDSLARYIRTERERLQVRYAFSHYMAPEMVEQLASNPDKLILGGESRVLSVMFCDMRDFTTISEYLPPVELTQLMNRFLSPITEMILSHHGTIDKFIGDSVMAFWNAPLRDARHGFNAAKAALAVREALTRLNDGRQQEARATGQRFFPLSATIGINTGECCVGNMGTAQRFNYTALGDGVNVASRLQEQCKYYGVDIIVGESTVRELHGMAMLELDFIRVKGRQHPIRIYTLLGDEALAARPDFATLAQDHNTMLVAYRHCEWDAAEQALRNCMAKAREIAEDLSEKLYPLFLERIAHYRQFPPEPGWDGIYDPRRGAY